MRAGLIIGGLFDFRWRYSILLDNFHAFWNNLWVSRIHYAYRWSFHFILPTTYSSRYYGFFFPQQ
jgi:hypothetical protein